MHGSLIMFHPIVNQVLQLHQDTVQAWHQQPIDVFESVDQFVSDYTPPIDDRVVESSRCPLACDLLASPKWLETICRQHSFNYLLWHEEDVARSPSVGDAEIAKVKRAIDGYNQKRNDWIEKVDDLLSDCIKTANIQSLPNAKLNTETPGSTIDRLSIMSLRLYHLMEQIQRDDVDQTHREKVQQKIQLCQLQHRNLSQSLVELLSDISSGHKRHVTYRQCKMYNDPTLNPAVYNASRKAA